MHFKEGNKGPLLAQHQRTRNPVNANVTKCELPKLQPTTLNKSMYVSWYGRSTLNGEFLKIRAAMNKHVPKFSRYRLILCSGLVSQAITIGRLGRTIHKEVYVRFIKARTKVKRESREVTEIKKLDKSRKPWKEE